jgi:hypothetical protein
MKSVVNGIPQQIDAANVPGVESPMPVSAVVNQSSNRLSVPPMDCVSDQGRKVSLPASLLASSEYVPCSTNVVSGSRSSSIESPALSHCVKV